MNRLLPILLAAVVLASGPVRAQEPPPDGPPHRKMRPDPRMNGPLDRFLGQLAQENPEEFERLKQLREQDPERFHEHLEGRRDQLRVQQFLKSLTELPRFREVINSLTPEERAQLQERFRRFVSDDSDWRKNMRRSNPDRKQGPDPESQIRQLARSFHEAPDEKKQVLRTKLREQLEASFDAGEAERSRNIEEVEGRLNKLKEILATRADNREAIIERRLEELTNVDPLAW